MPQLFRPRRRFSPIVAAAFAALTAAGAQATETREGRPLDAVVRALGFLDSGPRGGDFVIAVVHRDGDSDAQMAAVDARMQLDGLPGPRRTRLRAASYTVDDFLESTGGVDAALLVPGLTADSERLAEFVREHRILTVSTDPACLDAGACVLMVSTDRNVEIVLDTRLAGLVGAQFSTVFTMMVTRR